MGILGIGEFLGNGILALQNLQATLSLFLLAGTIWFFPHLGQVRLRARNVQKMALLHSFRDQEIERIIEPEHALSGESG